MLFNNSEEKLTLELEHLFSQEPNEQTDAKIFELATKLVALDANNHRALYILAQCYHLQIGTDRNIKKAIELYSLLTKNADFNAEDTGFQYKFATALKDTNDNTCFVWYLRASLNGDQYSTYLIGSMLTESNLLGNIPYVKRYDLAMAFMENAIRMDAEQDITDLAKDKLNLMKKEREIKDLALRKEEKICELLESKVNTQLSKGYNN